MPPEGCHLAQVGEADGQADLGQPECPEQQRPPRLLQRRLKLRLPLALMCKARELLASYRRGILFYTNSPPRRQRETHTAQITTPELEAQAAAGVIIGGNFSGLGSVDAGLGGPNCLKSAGTPRAGRAFTIFMVFSLTGVTRRNSSSG